MKAKTIYIFWGVVLVLLGGGLLMAGNLGYINFSFDIRPEPIWIVIFGVLGAMFFLTYFMMGVRNWGWLFPAFFCTALALTTWMGVNHREGSFMGAPVLASAALPFYVGFALNRKRVGLIFPAIILTALTLVTLVADTVLAEWIAPLVLYAIGAPFLVVYLLDRSKRWALIPAGILAYIGTFPLLTNRFVDMLAMFFFALPFFVVYFWSKKNWWALIPAGIMSSIGVVNILSMAVSILPMYDNLVPQRQDFDPILSSILLLGFALTFGLLWLRRKTQPTDWAKYPAIGLITIALLTLVLGKNILNSWPVALSVVGIAMLATSLWPRRSTIPARPQEQS